MRGGREGCLDGNPFLILTISLDTHALRVEFPLTSPPPQPRTSFPRVLYTGRVRPHPSPSQDPNRETNTAVSSLTPPSPSTIHHVPSVSDIHSGFLLFSHFVSNCLHPRLRESSFLLALGSVLAYCTTTIPDLIFFFSLYLRYCIGVPA